MYYYHNNLLTFFFKMKKTHKLITLKYHWPNLCQDINTYVKSYLIYLNSKTVFYKAYEEL